MKHLENLENLSDTPAGLDEQETAPTPEESQTGSPKAPDQAGTDISPEIERLMAEAEQRGYIRGRNESIEATLMPPPTRERQDTAESCPAFLAHLRPGFWDN